MYYHIRWYHSSLTGREAETLLLAKGQDGSYLVRSSVHNPGSFVLSARVDERVSHVMIRNKDNNFVVGGGPTFPSLTELVEHYKKNPMVETSGTVINLKVPFHATSFLPANIQARVVELQKQHQDVYGKAGFWEEFEVSLLLLLLPKLINVVFPVCLIMTICVYVPIATPTAGMQAPLQ